MAAAPKRNAKGERIYGPYKGSKDNGGRPLYVIRKADGSTTTVNKARKDYEDKHHVHLSHDTDVDHKDNNKNDDKTSNLRAMPHGDNVAKENMHRAGRQWKKNG